MCIFFGGIPVAHGGASYFCTSFVLNLNLNLNLNLALNLALNLVLNLNLVLVLCGEAARVLVLSLTPPHPGRCPNGSTCLRRRPCVLRSRRQ